MYPRLKLARNLLTDDGVIFISIDDNEVTNLKKICDEIFGEENFIGNICHKNRDGVSNDKIISSNHNHILFYVKKYSIVHSNRDNFGIVRTEEDFKNYTKNDNDGKGLYTLNPVTGPGGEKKGNPYYEILGVSNYWRFGKERMEKLIKENIVIKINNNLYQKTYKSEMLGKKKGATTWWDNVGTTAQGTKDIKDIFGGSYFDFSKPISLIKYIMKYIDSLENSIVLDFFSGSATTAHAVMQLNAEDGGNRKYIMVQLPEVCDEKSEAYKAGYKNICEIGKERIRRAGEKIKSDETLPAENREKLDIGFKVFKLDSSNIKEWDSETEDLKQSLFDSIDNIKSDRISLDILYEILLKYGLDLNVPIVENKHFYSIGGGTLLINLDKEIGMEVIDSICEEYKTLLEIDEDFKTTVVLRDSSFANDVDKTNAMKKLEQVGIKEVRSI